MYNNNSSSLYKKNTLTSSTHSASNLLGYNKLKTNGSSLLQKQNQNSSYLSPTSPTNNPYKNKHLGLNPNLPIQDQYVENLLKQIHFMTMEIKLLKEKQTQSQNNTLWGIINRTNEPLVKNIIVSQEKYQEMKLDMDFKQEQLKNQNTRLANEQNAILKEYEYLEGKLNSLRQRKDKFDHGFRDKNGKNIVKILQYVARLKIITAQKQMERKRNQTFVNELDSIIMEGEKEQSKSAYQLSKIRNDQIIEQQMQKEKINQIQQIKKKIEILKEKFQSNEDYQRAQEEQTLLRERIGNLQKGISGANFDLMQLNESIKMAEIQKEKQIKERKQLTQQFESVKTMLMEILFMNLGRTHKQSENRKRESVQIQKAQYQTKKLQKNLQEIKKKLLKSQDTQNQLRIEVESLQRQLQKLKAQRQQLKAHLTSLSTKNEQQERILSAYTSQLRKLDDSFYKVSHDEFTLTLQLQSIQKQIHYLKGRKDYLTETLNLKDIFSETKLEDLQRVVQKNNDLNETVNMLMGKMEEIKSFSRM